MTAPTLTPSLVETTEPIPEHPFCSECSYVETPDLPQRFRRGMILLVDATGSWETCTSCAIGLVAAALSGGQKFTIVFDDAPHASWLAS